MVKGLRLFRDHFERFTESYAIIGGAAASEWFAKENYEFRVTKDIDIVILIESLDDSFLQRFWEFVKLGAYEVKQRSDESHRYYRFAKPQDASYPDMLELFSRSLEGLKLRDEQTIVPIPKDEDASSLSAILMDQDYYRIVLDFRQINNGLPLITPPGIILLKSRAWLDLRQREQAGEKVDSKHIKKHRNDVFRLAMLLPAEKSFSIPLSVHGDFQRFLSAFPEESAEWQNIKDAMGKKPPMLPAGEMIAALNRLFIATD